MSDAPSAHTTVVLARPGRGSNRATIERTLSIAAPLLLLILWEAGATSGFINKDFFPAPSQIVATAIEMLRDGELWKHTSVSLVRVIVGFLIGSLAGIVLGILMALYGPVRAAIMPLVNATFPIPKLAVLPLFILIFGLGEASKYAIIAVTVVYMTLINTYEGVRDIPRIYRDVGHNFGASPSMTFFDIALPGAMPAILTGLRLSLGVSLLVIVAAEFVGAKAGIGYLIWNSWQVFMVEKMYVGLMTTAVLGFASSLLFDLVERLVLHWRPVAKSG